MNCNFKFCVKHHYDNNYQGIHHAHPCYEIVFYCSGNGEVVINGTKYNFTKNNFSVIPPNSEHIEKGESDTEVLYIGFDITSNEVLKEGVFCEEEYEILHYLENIYKETRGANLNRFSANVVELLTQLVAYSLINEKTREVGQDKYEIVKKAKTFISENYMHNIDIMSIAKSVGYSYDYFRHVFFQIENMTVRDYILQERLNYAKEMLLSGRFQIKEIAVACGFSSLSHFCSVFKKSTGKRPQDYLKDNNVYMKTLYADIKTNAETKKDK